MLALLNEYPNFCPGCGMTMHPESNGSDFFAGAALECRNCNASFAYVAGPALLKLASEHGDIGQYVKTADVL
jgi:NADH pyrophosphatase NudC (nudix superfamily)